jgi:hypothetical protein
MSEIKTLRDILNEWKWCDRDVEKSREEQVNNLFVKNTTDHYYSISKNVITIGKPFWNLFASFACREGIIIQNYNVESSDW